MLRKPNKVDYTAVKSYQEIYLLNCLGKIHKEVAADILTE